ncbi:DUF2177 family protein [Erythrobacter litoralis]|uniref:DUF2177 family protein n=1 Tax=Erythrobacter litoralis (strain HTCC2594) TaxID=314225 RepID=Q2NAT6_ERYLH|nr:DUF2177 family protein [Erythrobacter litoralis]ABC63205.1 hypothetical protein ELI_05565 [Erythrobacter litoralis HTCC2594]
MTWIIAYIAAALVFGILDAIWLGWAGNNFYRPNIGEIMADSFRAVPAIIFYVFYVAGMVYFAIRPGLANGLGTAALNGALLGALCYGTWGLTNQATLKVWPSHLTVTDIAWGAFATGMAALAATWITGRLT